MTKQTTTAAKKDRKAAKATAAAPAKNGRIIAKIVSANRAQDTAAILHDGSTHIVSDYATHGVTAKVGDNFDDLKAKYLRAIADRKAAKGPGRLANGLDGRNAPHSAKAVSDNKAAAKPTAAPKADKKAARKAAKAEKAAPKADDQRKITIVDKKFTFGGDGTARRASWDACKASKTVAAYIAAGGKAKYLPRWVSAGAVKLG